MHQEKNNIIFSNKIEKQCLKVENSVLKNAINKCINYKNINY